MNLIRAFSEYSDIIVPSYDVIAGLMESSSSESRFAGFQVAEIFLRKGVEFFETTNLNNLLVSVLDGNDKSYVPELIGCYLNFLKSKSLKSVYDTFATLVVKKLKKMGSDKFIRAMSKIGKRDPSILMPFYKSEFFGATSLLFGKLKLNALECVKANAAIIPSLWTELYSRGFIETIRRRYPTTVVSKN